MWAFERKSYTLTLGRQFNVVRAQFTENYVPAFGRNNETYSRSEQHLQL
jgi:hypothetical protein